VIGKQLVGKKAQFAGDDLADTTRSFGTVVMENVIDVDHLRNHFGRFGGKLDTVGSYPPTGRPTATRPPPRSTRR
jgi:hypothetical protein